MSLMSEMNSFMPSEILKFHLPAHGDVILSQLKALREENLFCDITLLLAGQQGTDEEPWHFCGHRVVLAASSDFLRDQFLLHKDQAELRVGVVSCAEVGERLLLSCYTAQLEFPVCQLLNYLTTASALQMSQVVEKCVHAVSQCLSPTLALFDLKMEEEEEGEEEMEDILQPDSGWPSPSFPGQEERDGAQPSTRIQESNKKESCTLAVETIEATFVQGTETGSGGQSDAKPQPTEEAPCGILSENLQEPVDGMGDDRGTANKSDSLSVQEPYLCRRCDRVFQHLQSYEGHLSEHRQHLCRVCGQRFPHSTGLSHHVRSHAGVRRLRCPLCHRTFHHQVALQDHFDLHTGDSPHRCNYCLLRFAHKSGLRRHLKGCSCSLKNM